MSGVPKDRANGVSFGNLLELLMHNSSMGGLLSGLQEQLSPGHALSEKTIYLGPVINPATEEIEHWGSLLPRFGFVADWDTAMKPSSFGKTVELCGKECQVMPPYVARLVARVAKQITPRGVFCTKPFHNSLWTNHECFPEEATYMGVYDRASGPALKNHPLFVLPVFRLTDKEVLQHLRQLNAHTQ